MGFWLWLHLVAMAFFVGGQLMLAAVVVPVERGAPDRERLRAMARRFGIGSLYALGVLIVSGSAMASDDDRWGSATLHVKLAFVALTILAVVWHMRRPQQHAIEGLVFAFSLTIVALGVALATS
jgi:putative copper export protein